MKFNKPGRSVIFTALCLLASNRVLAGEGDWYINAGVEGVYINYNGSPRYESLLGIGGFFQADYLERASFIVGYNHNYRTYQSAASAPGDMNENVFFVSGKGNFHPGDWPGPLSVRLDGYSGSDKYGSFEVAGIPGRRTVNMVDDFTVISPMVSYLNYARTFYLDLGYSYSSYRFGGTSLITLPQDIDVSQWTPTVGFAFNQSRDWLRFRAYLINLSNSDRVNGRDSTSALETKWTHWFVDTPGGLDSLTLNLLLGERIYAVDSDSYTVYSTPDMQKSLLAIDGEWMLGENARLLAEVGYTKYEDVVLAEDYNSTHFYLQWSYNW